MGAVRRGCGDGCARRPTAHGEVGQELYDALLAKLPRVLDAERALLDFPIAGLVLFGIGSWGLLRGSMPVEAAVRLVVLAERFAYARYLLTLDLGRMLEAAEERAPGVAAEVRAEYGDRRGPELLDEAKAVAASLRERVIA